MLIAVRLSRHEPGTAFDSLMKGVRHESRRWRVPVVGGDTKLGDSNALLGVALGSAHSRRNLFLKGAARPGDLLWISGEIGSCNAAVFVGLRNRRMSPAWERWARTAITTPKLPLMKSRKLSLAGLGRGGTDISDGLGADLQHLCLASGTGAIVDAERIPVRHKCKRWRDSSGSRRGHMLFRQGAIFSFS